VSYTPSTHKGGGLIVGFAFGRHCSHLTARADEIAHRHGAWHINSTDLDGTRRGWFPTAGRR
jgi:hypothetical protein